MKALWCWLAHRVVPIAAFNQFNRETVALWNRGGTYRCTICGHEWHDSE